MVAQVSDPTSSAAMSGYSDMRKNGLQEKKNGTVCGKEEAVGGLH